MAIKIPVSAQFDAADLQQQIKMVNDQIRILASQVGNANKQKWEPINLKSKDDLQGFIKQMDLLMKKQTDFATKMKQTGQGGNPLFADFKKMAEGRLGEQIKYMESVLGWAGVEFSNLPAPKPPKKPPVVPPAPPSPPEPAWRKELGRQGMSGLHSILGNAGPIGGTISNALNTGMSSGASAGMAGLVGGL
ncbi:lytic transglycosylase, partial [Escherichia coli]